MLAQKRASIDTKMFYVMVKIVKNGATGKIRIGVKAFFNVMNDPILCNDILTTIFEIIKKLFSKTVNFKN